MLLQGEWADRWQSALEGPSTGAMSEEDAAEALTDLQVSTGMEFSAPGEGVISPGGGRGVRQETRMHSSCA